MTNGNAQNIRCFDARKCPRGILLRFFNNQGFVVQKYSAVPARSVGLSLLATAQ